MFEHLDLILSEPVLHILYICTPYYVQLSMHVLWVPAEVPCHIDYKIEFSLERSIEIYHTTVLVAILWEEVSVCPDRQTQRRVLGSQGEKLIEDLKVVKGWGIKRGQENIQVIEDKQGFTLETLKCLINLSEKLS